MAVEDYLNLDRIGVDHRRFHRAEISLCAFSNATVMAKFALPTASAAFRISSSVWSSVAVMASAHACLAAW